MLYRLLRFLLATLICAVIISIGSTQIVLDSVNSFGLDIDLGVRLEATLSDIIGLAPIVLLVVGAAYFIGFIIAWLLSKVVLNQQVWGIIAGLTSVPAAMVLMNQVIGMEVLFISQHLSGWIIIVLASFVGSQVFHRTIPSNKTLFT